MTHVPGLLPDHPTSTSRRDMSPPPLPCWLRVVDRDVETASVGDKLFGKLDLLPLGLPRFFDHSLVGDRSVEVAVAVGVGPEQLGHPLAGQQQLEPARSTSARWRTGPSSDSVEESMERQTMASASRPSHFGLPGEAQTAQRLHQRGALVSQTCSVFTRVVVGKLAVLGEHVCPVAWCS